MKTDILPRLCELSLGGQHMRRREFIGLIGAAAVANPLVARSQQYGGMRRVGVLLSYAESDPLAQIWLKASLEEMQALGWIDGRNVRLDVRWPAASRPTGCRSLRKNWSTCSPMSSLP